MNMLLQLTHNICLLISDLIQDPYHVSALGSVQCPDTVGWTTEKHMPCKTSAPFIAKGSP